MKKLLILIIVVFAISNSAWAGTYSGGDGSAGNPYQIGIYADLIEFSTTFGDWGADFIITANIDASATSTLNAGAGFSPVGNNGTHFTGSFDGQGYEISNLYINRPATNFIGLFGYTSNSIIENIGIVDCDITGSQYVGGIVAFNVSSTVNNSYTTGSISGSLTVGGVVGENFSSSTVSNCYATTSVTATSGLGGLVGYNINSSIVSNSYATGNITGSGATTGGLVGRNYNSSTVSNCYATGNVSATGNIVGGLIGENYASAIISNSYATGTISGSTYVGGLVGDNDNSTISSSYATGSAAGDSYYVGGLIGWNKNNSTVGECYCTGSSVGTGHIGGFVGENLSSTISECYSTGNITGVYTTGGFLGRNSGATLNNCYCTGDITRSSGTAVSIGGFVGDNSNSTIEYSYSIGNAAYNGVADPTNKGFLGEDLGGSTFTNNFFDEDASNQTTATGATATTTANMKTESTFTDASWNFTSIWSMQSSVNNSYPYLIDVLGSVPINFITITSTNIEFRTESTGTIPKFEISTSIDNFTGAIQVSATVTDDIALGTKARNTLTAGTTYYVRYKDDSTTGDIYSFILAAGTGTALIKIGN